ncbi:Carbamoyl-phosphate synthase small chain [Candidatus Kinetoplastibacterium sorsogonicusi]|uniref:Carbamoyl phosphate synthase small chain n=1 Tax=Candidatus Kinetoplastidibacterium kentomonadis TaxID=1576550 RepID=A0A3Q8ER40_9PROT|nr:glutamine-hydrolyzing carbamoyl-phosphate synthase small subunit [Candidatus Kinetoplastibacterium sorsogonicusi]AWD32278.1 Carbamoyl-phosphate synthase small chain [Candidatus Kinetoplastibacterium sorsogonicusi]
MEYYNILDKIKKSPPAILALSNGTIFYGISIGVTNYVTAEIVFNTSMTGYQEIATDPSYSGQIVTLTHPHIGNTGVNNEDIESNKVHISGLVIRDYPNVYSNFRSNESLSSYLIRNNIIAISGIDTRKLTKILRELGTQGACIFVGTDENFAIKKAKEFAGMKGQELATEVSTKRISTWNENSWNFEIDKNKKKEIKFHVVVYDFGVKSNILRLLVDRGCKLTIVPATTTAEDVLKLNPDGIFLSNGPGDPETCEYAIKATKKFINMNIPLFGICLGHQIISLAIGAKTIKMKTGHHGANHPIKDLATGQVFITSQNHGFTVDIDTLPKNARPTHISLFDNTLQGMELIDHPVFCFQGHPEGSPGPHDIHHLFDKFIKLMSQTVIKENENA